MNHPDWAKEPYIRDGYKAIPGKSRAVAYIFGQGTDGRSYCYAVETNSVDATAQKRLECVLQRVKERGPSVCKPVNGGDLPRAQDVPDLEC